MTTTIHTGQKTLAMLAQEDIRRIIMDTGLRVNLCCGSDYRPGWANLDIADFPGYPKPDIYWDARKHEIPFPDDSADEVVAGYMLAHIGRILQEELSPRQLAMMQAVALKGVPMEALGQKLGVERNALYKMMHDARLKLKRRLAREGLELSDVMATFEGSNTSEARVVKGGSA